MVVGGSHRPAVGWPSPHSAALILSLHHLLLPITSFAEETPSIPTCTPWGLGDVQFSLQVRNRLRKVKCSKITKLVNTRCRSKVMHVLMQDTLVIVWARGEEDLDLRTSNVDQRTTEDEMVGWCH